MINVLKGYTRNGLRKHCWITSQGDDHILRVQTVSNIRQKYGNFERIRQLCEEDQPCRRLIKDFDKIATFYFSKLTEVGQDFSSTQNSRSRRLTESIEQLR